MEAELDRASLSRLSSPAGSQGVPADPSIPNSIDLPVRGASAEAARACIIGSTGSKSCDGPEGAGAGGSSRVREAEGPLPAEEDDVYVHEGVLRCAEAIASDLERSGVLRAVLDGDGDARRRLGHTLYEQDCRGWRLVRPCVCVVRPRVCGSNQRSHPGQSVHAK